MIAATHVLVLTDNLYLAQEFQKIVCKKPLLQNIKFSYCCSPASLQNMGRYGIESVLVRSEWPQLVQRYSLIISIHCKQLFPAEMIHQVRCINVHPGLNPYNRGWFPQVFSILNKLPLGATIHEIDADLDHGPIIAQQIVPIYDYDTSLTAYTRVQEAELRLIDEHIVALISGEYTTFAPNGEGNLNLKKDFNNMMKLDLDEVLTMRQAIDRLRAMTHGSYRNAYFYGHKNKKIYVNILLEPDSD